MVGRKNKWLVKTDPGTVASIPIPGGGAHSLHTVQNRGEFCWWYSSKLSLIFHWATFVQWAWQSREGWTQRWGGTCAQFWFQIWGTETEATVQKISKDAVSTKRL